MLVTEVNSVKIPYYVSVLRIAIGDTLVEQQFSISRSKTVEMILWPSTSGQFSLFLCFRVSLSKAWQHPPVVMPGSSLPPQDRDLGARRQAAGHW